MVMFELAHSPAGFLSHMLGEALPHDLPLDAYEQWWETRGRAISSDVDRAGTAWIRQYDLMANRIDELVFPSGYRDMLLEGYQNGVIWRGFAPADEGLTAVYALGYIAGYYDTGLYCPYTVSLATAAVVDKYAAPDVRARYLPRMLARDETVWQGATWMTEARGGSDLGNSVETIARQTRAGWRLTGEKYFCSNANAELAVVAARPEDAPPGVRGLALFLVPRYRQDGSLNVYIRRLKDKIATRSVPTGEVELRDSEAYLLGKPEHGIYLIMEVLNLSRVANNIGSVSLMQNALAQAYAFASERQAFGKRLLDQPLMRRQFEQKWQGLHAAFALAWETVLLAEEAWREPAGSYSERFQLFRIMIHLAKYWTAEQAVQYAKWAMEVNGGQGTLAEFGVERLLREAMITDIWEGPPHRQALDGLEAMERKGAHRLLFAHLAPYADAGALQDMQARVEAHLALAQAEKEAGAFDLFDALAPFAASALVRKYEAIEMMADRS
ncbi:MAG: acyl-CoA dehydrogenase family protein [Anaerolineae bacterium]|nr:acyl-CoA dehydrogenase family protein [Anaerolineae bacterium]